MILQKIKQLGIINRNNVKNQIFSSWFIFSLVNILLVVFQIIYITLRYEYINPQIPFFYTKLWGDQQLADKYYLFTLPLISLMATAAGLHFHFKAKKYYYAYLDRMTIVFLIVCNTIITLSLINIIFKASIPFEPLININVPKVLPYFFLAFVVTYAITPMFIDLFKEKNIVTIPSLHKHPSMILKRPSARGGGFIFSIVVLFLSILVVGFKPSFTPIYIGTALLAILGLVDDYQNTNPKSKARIMENPMIRLGLMIFIVMLGVIMGIRIDYISNPGDGIFDFTRYTFSLGSLDIHWVAVIFTIVWIVWVLNVLSWSNGVDGQYGGIVGISFIVIALLALRFSPVEDLYFDTAKIAMISAGAAFGLTRYNWYPSKIMWGFGAICAGFIIASTSILVGGKIAASILIILVPFFDATVTFVRRIIQKKNPLKGDRGHLHHLLMEKGWGVRRISIFYWFTTALSGTIVLLSSGRDNLLLTLTLGGFVAFFILLLNIKAQRGINILRTKEVSDIS